MSHSLTTLVRLLISIALFICMFLIFGHAKGQSQSTLTISGNSDAIVFTVNWDQPTTLPIIWGVSGKPMQPATVTLTSRTTTVVPPNGSVSVFFNQSGVIVDTTFRILTNDGWFELPQATHTITISGSLSQIQFVTDFDPTTSLNITWGISNQSTISQAITLTNRTATVVPPPQTVSLLFIQPRTVVSTTFTSLGAGWYQVPFASPIVYSHFVYMPSVNR